MKALHDLRTRLIVLTGALISVSLLIAGCSAPSTAAPTPTATLVVIYPSATSTHAPTPTNTSTLTPTPVVVSTQIPPKVDVGIDRVWVSPDNDWIAAIIDVRVKIRPDEKSQTLGYYDHRTILQVADSEFSKEWVVEDIPAEDIMSYEMPWPLAWSRDGQYLYFTHRKGGGDGCFTEANYYGADLLKVSLTDGRVSEVVPRVGYWVALSPDESKFAYLNEDQSDRQKLVIRDLVSGVEHVRPVDEFGEYSTFTHASNLLWSPDGKRLVYTFSIDPCGSAETASTSIIVVDASTLIQKTLIREDKRWFQSIEWLDNDKVLLKSTTGESWWMNPSTGSLLEAK